MRCDAMRGDAGRDGAAKTEPEPLFWILMPSSPSPKPSLPSRRPMLPTEPVVARMATALTLTQRQEFYRSQGDTTTN
jgi:hypothetical protein